MGRLSQPAPPVSVADAVMRAIEDITTKLPRLATQSRQ